MEEITKDFLLFVIYIYTLKQIGMKVSNSNMEKLNVAWDILNERAKQSIDWYSDVKLMKGEASMTIEGPKRKLQSILGAMFIYDGSKYDKFSLDGLIVTIDFENNRIMILPKA